MEDGPKKICWKRQSIPWDCLMYGWMYYKSDIPKRKNSKFVPISFHTKESSRTISENLYTSHNTIIGILASYAAMATTDVPTRDMTSPLENTALAPTITLVQSLIAWWIAFVITYEHEIPLEERSRNVSFPNGYKDES